MQNPFKPVKFEEEDERRLVYVTKAAQKQFEEGNFYFTGKRGCGKTTCLMSADSEFRAKYEVSGASPRGAHVFGVYLALNFITLPNFFTIPATGDNKRYLSSSMVCQGLTLEFLELLIIFTTLKRLVKTCKLRKLDLSHDTAISVCNIVSENYNIPAAKSLDVAIVWLTERLNAFLDVASNIAEAKSIYRPRLENPFHHTLTAILDAISEETNLKVIRILVDDAEVLDDKLQLALNTLVRTPRTGRVFWSVAFVQGRFNTHDTFVNNQSALAEERAIVFLDRTKDFHAFAEAVCRMRVERYYPDHHNFSISNALSRFDINMLIALTMRDTQSKKALRFKQSVEQQSAEPPFPFYQQYLFNCDRNFGKLSGAGLRKKNVAAYIHLCGRYQLKPIYAGLSAILLLSDGCIRDLLLIVGAIFDVSAVEPESMDNFFGGAILPDFQDKGVRRNAEQRIGSIRDYSETNGRFTERLVSYLGELVAVAQQEPSNEPLKNPDRAWFRIRGLAEHGAREVRHLIQSAIVEGYIREQTELRPDRDYCFRLHRQFAPAFNYSYREMADEFISISVFSLAKLLERDARPAKEWAHTVYWERRPHSAQGDLISDESKANEV